ncbi:MAG: C4-dicarboxylate ABC transporter permease [Rhodothalassiaceae bacterium]|nr:MAG: C4-dicarboxylate ABC transporter permease [Rhodothalassiaceae bacterium]
MTDSAVDLVVVAAALLAIWRGLAVGVALALSGLIGIAWHTASPAAAFAVLGAETAGVLAREPMWMAAFFLLMATALARSGLAARAFAGIAAAGGSRPRRLAVITAIFAGLLGAVSGSVLASVGALRQMAREALIAAGLPEAGAAALVAAGASLSTLIPPSLVLVFYAAFAQLPVREVFLAALPAGVLGTLLAALAAHFATPRPAPRRRGDEPAGRSVHGEPTATAVFFGLFLLVFGLLYGGWMTALEVAALGAFLACCWWFRDLARRGGWSVEAAAAGAEIAAILTVLLGAFVFSTYLALSGLPEQVLAAVAGRDWPPVAVVVVLLAAYLLLGMVLEPIALIVATLPLSLPVVEALGYSPLWWGAALASVAATGLLTPPMGLAVFTAGAGAAAPAAAVFRAAAPYLAADALRLGIIVLWPGLATLLPRLLQ